MSKIIYYCLRPALFRLDGGAMYGIIPKPLWEKVSPPDHHNRIDLSLNCLLIKTPTKAILIDTGIGDYHPEKFKQMFDIRDSPRPLAACLAGTSLAPEDITDLVITHLHFDHVGGIGHKNAQGEMVPIFPNATLHLHQDHYRYSLAPTQRDRGSFHDHYYGPILDYYRERQQIHWLVEMQGTILTYEGHQARDCDKTHSLNYLTSNGHTPHLIHPYDKKFIFLADIIPTSNHLHLPWVMGYDLMPGQSVADKQRILDFIVQENLTLVFEHDINYWGATLTKNAKGNTVPDQLFKVLRSQEGLGLRDQNSFQILQG